MTLLDELQALGVGFVSLGEGIDLSTPEGKLQLHILAALAEFERGRIQERVKAGLARAKRNGQRLGRPRVELNTRDSGLRMFQKPRRRYFTKAPDGTKSLLRYYA